MYWIPKLHMNPYTQSLLGEWEKHITKTLSKLLISILTIFKMIFSITKAHVFSGVIKITCGL